eukprot:gene8798-746_t
MTEEEEIIIREAYFSDTFSISDCNQACLPLYYGFFEIFCFLLSPSMRIFIAETKNQKFVGYLIGSFPNDKSKFHIISFGVYEKYRRRKIGSRLIDKSVDFAKLNGKEKLTLNVHLDNESGIKFYKKIGFKVVELMKDYYGDQLTNVKSHDAYKMEKIIL